MVNKNNMTGVRYQHDPRIARVLTEFGVCYPFNSGGYVIIKRYAKLLIFFNLWQEYSTKS